MLQVSASVTVPCLNALVFPMGWVCKCLYLYLLVSHLQWGVKVFNECCQELCWYLLIVSALMCRVSTGGGREPPSGTSLPSSLLACLVKSIVRCWGLFVYLEPNKERLHPGRTPNKPPLWAARAFLLRRLSPAGHRAAHQQLGTKSDELNTQLCL